MDHENFRSIWKYKKRVTIVMENHMPITVIVLTEAANATGLRNTENNAEPRTSRCGAGSDRVGSREAFQPPSQHPGRGKVHKDNHTHGVVTSRATNTHPVFD